ncbi:Isocitrate dehydrogenase kinase/phosphatase, partial [Clarias magur]
ITCILTYKASAASDHIKPGLAVLIVSTLTLITFCATAGVTIVFETATSNFNGYIPLSASLISLRTITDPLLCVLVSKEQFRLYKKTNTHTEEQ